jgi:hypothetical protein
VSRTRCSALRAAPQSRDPLPAKRMDPGSAAHHHSASKTRVNALSVLRSIRGTQPNVRHCERSEAIHSFFTRRGGLLRSARNDGPDAEKINRKLRRHAAAEKRHQGLAQRMRPL